MGSCSTRAVALLALLSMAVQAEVTPDQLEFRRQAVRRMIFDRSQELPLAGLDPAKVVGLEVMHPPVGKQVGEPLVVVEEGVLRVVAGGSRVTATRWVGGFNPFATYGLGVRQVTGVGEVGLMFRDSETGSCIVVTLSVENGAYQGMRWVLVKEGKEVERKEFALPKVLVAAEPVRLRVQMLAVGANLFVEHSGVSTLVGRVDFVKHLDLRRKDLMRRFEFCLHTALEAKATATIDGVTAALSPGVGQADIRNVTYEDGTPLFKDGRLWMLMTVRGGKLPHPMQGMFSLDPSVFDIRYEGLILYDRGDGLLRNDLASHIFHDRQTGEWRGFTTGFSSYGDPAKKEKKQIWAVRSLRSPLGGLVIMDAKPTGLVADYEDPQCIHDAGAKKWRMLLCENHQGYKAVVREADQWDGPYVRIAGPVDVDSTGTQIQTIGGKRYALFGSSDRKVYIYSYPDLQPFGELRMHRPPWDDESGTRVWPNVIPMPEGYPAPYIALMMDRLNFPGMKGSNWTYGAMYLYHGHLVTP